jgi:hypothetical protein
MTVSGQVVRWQEAATKLFLAVLEYCKDRHD